MSVCPTAIPKEAYLSGNPLKSRKMEEEKQEVFRERTFGSYPTVHEIRRSERRTERDSLVRLLRNSARQHSSIECSNHGGDTSHPRTSLTSRLNDEDRRSRLVNLLHVSHDRKAEADSSSSPQLSSSIYAPQVRDGQGKLPPLNDLHLKSQVPAASRHSMQGPSTNRARHSGGPATLQTLTNSDNINTHFHRSKSVVRKYFWIHPDWLSEGLTIKRLHLENRSDPMKFGWM